MTSLADCGCRIGVGHWVKSISETRLVDILAQPKLPKSK